MANLTLTTNSVATGVYAEAPMALKTTEAAVVVLVNDVTIEIEAAKTRWADNLPNLYTVTITNTDTVEPFDLDDAQSIKFETDAFDTAFVTIDTSSVSVSGNSAENIAVSASGVLSMDLKQAITDAEPTVITFEVNKVAPTP